jgi:hypothetical protein
MHSGKIGLANTTGSRKSEERCTKERRKSKEEGGDHESSEGRVFWRGQNAERQFGLYLIMHLHYTATGRAVTCDTEGSSSKPPDNGTLWPDSEETRREKSGWLVTQHEGEDSVG